MPAWTAAPNRSSVRVRVPIPAPAGVKRTPVRRPESSTQASRWVETGVEVTLPPSEAISDEMAAANTEPAGPEARESACLRSTVAR